jgi:hypothetical protein
MCAAIEGHTMAVKMLLLVLGTTNIQLKNKEGMNALHIHLNFSIFPSLLRSINLAAFHGHANVLHILANVIDCNVSKFYIVQHECANLSFYKTKQPATTKMTAIQYASSGGHIAAVSELLLLPEVDVTVLTPGRK